MPARFGILDKESTTSDQTTKQRPIIALIGRFFLEFPDFWPSQESSGEMS